jgi:hypothetical protein
MIEAIDRGPLSLTEILAERLLACAPAEDVRRVGHLLRSGREDLVEAVDRGRLTLAQASLREAMDRLRGEEPESPGEQGAFR